MSEPQLPDQNRQQRRAKAAKGERQTFEHFLRHVVRVEQHVQITQAQWVHNRVFFDDTDPIDLPETDRGIAIEIYGAVDRFPPEARHVGAWSKGARVGGTWFCALYILFSGLTADLSGLAAGEVGFGVIVAPDLRLAAQAFRYIIGAVDSTPSIARLEVSRTSDSITLRRSDGRLITIECLPASRGGAATRGRTFFAALMDEASFMRDADTGAVNDEEVFRSIVVRILLGGKLLIVSTAWLETGKLQALIQANHGHPVGAVAAVTPTLTMRDDDRIRQIVEEEDARDRANSDREFRCLPLGGGASAYLDGSAINAALTDGPISLAPQPGSIVGAAADFGFVSDSSALCIVQFVAGFYQLSELIELRPEKGSPLQPSGVVSAFAIDCARFGVRHLAADGHYREAIREHTEASGLRLRDLPEGQSGKIEQYSQVRALLHEGKCRISRDAKKLITQLREVVAKPTPGGSLSITSPRKKGGHGDLASAYVGAVWSAAHHGQRDARVHASLSLMFERGRRLRAAGFFSPRDMRDEQSGWNDLPPSDREERRRRGSGLSAPTNPPTTPRTGTGTGISSHARRQQRKLAKGED